MTEFYTRKYQGIYREVYNALAKEYKERTISIEFNKGVIDAIKSVEFSITNLINNNGILYRIDTTSVEHTKPSENNFYYDKIRTQLSEIQKILLRHRPCSNAVQGSEYSRGNLFVTFNIKNYIESCLVDEGLVDEGPELNSKDLEDKKVDNRISDCD